MIRPSTLHAGHRRFISPLDDRADGPLDFRYGGATAHADSAPPFAEPELCESQVDVEQTREQLAANGASRRHNGHRRRRQAARASVWRQYPLWLAPLAAEGVLFLSAAWLTFALERIMWIPGAGLPLASLAALGAAYLALNFYARLHELFLPRPVVALGVGALMVGTAGLIATFLADAYLVGGRSRLMLTSVATAPLLLFWGRGMLVFREAKHAPKLSELARNSDLREIKLRRLRRKLRFWLG